MEKRKYERKIVKGEVDGKMFLVNHLNILDLSMNGIHFKCIRRVDMNSIYRIRIEKNDVSLDITGQGVRSILCIEQRGGNSVPVYEVSMTFKDVSQEGKKSLEKLISLIGNG